MQNILHYAVYNMNEEMVRYLTSIDAESGILKNEKNVKN
jgi:hypothetical protein